MISSPSKEGLSIADRRQLLRCITALSGAVIVGFGSWLIFERVIWTLVAVAIVLPGMVLVIFSYCQGRKLDQAQRFEHEKSSQEQIVERLKESREQANQLSQEVELITLTRQIDHRRVEFIDKSGNHHIWKVPISHTLNMYRRQKGDQIRLVFQDLSDWKLADIAYHHGQNWFEENDLITTFFTVEQGVDVLSGSI